MRVLPKCNLPAQGGVDTVCPCLGQIKLDSWLMLDMLVIIFETFPTRNHNVHWFGMVSMVFFDRTYCPVTLPETNSLHAKMDGWNTSFLFGWPIFRGYVSFWEGKKEGIPSRSV